MPQGVRMTRLKPCPHSWCDGIPETVEILWRWQAGCPGCGAYTPFRDTEEEAIALWNVREAE
jgi:hypothetical protein